MVDDIPSDKLMTDPMYQMAFELWVIYYFMCESFDREVCTGPYHGEFGKMPANASEAHKMSENQKQVQLAITTVSVKEQIPTDAWVAAREEASGLGFEVQRDISWNSNLYRRVQNLYIDLKFVGR